jgi:peptidoglycan hydrolase CwlO-like protein
MKQITLSFVIFVCFSCTQSANKEKSLQDRVDSMELKIAGIYKPGLGEFMSSIQTHHAKLWFAGQNQNWKLADFEVHEIQETLEAIQKFISMIDPAMDSITHAVEQKNSQLFKTGFILLTNSCNNCHHATKHEFNVITIPENLPVVNQNFKPVQ